MRIVVLDDWDQMVEQSKPVQRLRSHYAVDVYPDRAADRETLLNRLEGAEIIVAIRERTRFPEDLLAQLPDLRLLAQTGGGLAHVDVEAARRRGIQIMTTPGSSNSSVVELVFALMLAMQRFIRQGDREIRQGQWPQRLGGELAGRRLGILGYGNIGKALVPIATAFGMELVSWGREGSRRRALADGVPFEPDLQRFMSQVDMLSIHVRLTPDTRGLLTAEMLRALPFGAMLVNTSRGEVIVEQDLIAALNDGRLAAAGLDVFAEEPLPADHPLVKLDQVILTPHVGWMTAETYSRCLEQTVSNIETYLGETASVASP